MLSAKLKHITAWTDQRIDIARRYSEGLKNAKAIATFSMTYIYAADIRVFLMGLVANGLKLIEGMNRQSRRIVFWAILLAVFVAVANIFLHIW